MWGGRNIPDGATSVERAVEFMSGERVGRNRREARRNSDRRAHWHRPAAAATLRPGTRTGSDAWRIGRLTT